MNVAAARSHPYTAYSLWGLTDPNAPVQARGEISIAANRQVVWDILTDVSGWGRLRSDIDAVSFAGPFQQGASASIETSGVTLKITVGLVDAPREMNWTTTSDGLVMTNRYVLVPENGSTIVVCQETLSAPSFPQFDSAELGERIRVWLRALKRAAEEAGKAAPLPK
jgi:hypothetical protein